MATKSIVKQVTLHGESARQFVAALEKAESATPPKKQPQGQRVQHVEKGCIAAFFRNNGSRDL